MKYIIRVLVCVAAIAIPLSSCKKEETQASVPQASQVDTGRGKASDALVRYYAALNSHDTSKFVSIIPYMGARDSLRAFMVQRLASKWANRHADLTILSDTSVNDTSVVTYHIRITGDFPQDTTRVAKMVFVNGRWKNVTEPPPFHPSFTR